MANTFKVKTKASVSHSSLATVYTVPSSTTTVILGLILCNKTTSSITADVQLVSDTSDTETNADVFLLKGTTIPGGSSLEVLSGGKVNLQTTDVLKVQASAATSLDVSLSIMEIT
tara:strand:- start:50 stop:394 length:345 start_codon:yes stop_codon:yes gene_type:complete